VVLFAGQQQLPIGRPQNRRFRNYPTGSSSLFGSQSVSERKTECGQRMDHPLCSSLTPEPLEIVQYSCNIASCLRNAQALLIRGISPSDQGASWRTFGEVPESAPNLAHREALNLFILAPVHIWCEAFSRNRTPALVDATAWTPNQVSPFSQIACKERRAD